MVFCAFCLLSFSFCFGLSIFFVSTKARQQVEQRLGAQIEERERIARELHDTLLQGFQGLMLRFQEVMKILPKDGPAQAVMETVLDRADEVLLEGRERVKDLRIGGKADDDLPNMLTNIGEELSQDKEAEFSLSVIGTPQALNQALCHDAYRIGREAILNAFQHAAAVKVEVEITYSRRGIRLRIRDDGTGISQAILDKGSRRPLGFGGHARACPENWREAQYLEPHRCRNRDRIGDPGKNRLPEGICRI